MLEFEVLLSIYILNPVNWAAEISLRERDVQF